MKSELRPATREDAAVLAALHRQCFEPAWSEYSFLTLMESEKVFGFIAACGTGIFEAFVLARTAADEGEILTLGTVLAARHRGLAKLLVHATMQEAMRRGAGRLFLETDENNHSALDLYARLGFEQTGRRPDYYESKTGPAAGALILCRDLAVVP